jgi:hypothetical protein
MTGGAMRQMRADATLELQQQQRAELEKVARSRPTDGAQVASPLRRRRPSGVAQRASARTPANTPPDLDLHLIVDNYVTHKHGKVKA